ncbi:MAG: signal recognition particle-docking protein FtsY [Sulfurospirillum sp.]|nr:MAG: signal recognition particle-docking protein FtsY [Sulfurospirillum sp.]
MFGFFKKVLSKTTERIKEVAPKRSDKISKEDLEDILLEADVSYDQVEEIIYYMPPSNMVSRKDVRRVLLAYFVDIQEDKDIGTKPYIELVFGVNGAGKTTTIAKLANLYKTKLNKTVLLGASDTFRAAAIEQLVRWADKIDVPIVATKQGHDPSAVAFDTISSAIAKGIDRVIIDTAGRLQTQKNLSSELQKITRICNKAKEGAPHRKILILDGTQGNAAISQAKAFNDIVGVDALIITKLDGTAKGGALFSIAKELKKPILYIGVGESENDLIEFDKEEFVDSLLDAFFEEEA